MEIAELMDRVNILDYISQYCTTEQKSGGEFWALSPLKDENTPSFSVNVEKQRFYDFSSGKYGDVIGFIQEYHKCNFHKAVSILKEYAGVTDDITDSEHQHLSATKVAKKFASREQRQTKESAVSALDDNYMDRFERDWSKLSVWESEGITRDAMAKFQVMYDSFSDRIVFPIKDLSGKIINVSGRTLDPNYKENKVRKYTYFRSVGTLNTIYGLSDNMDEIRRRNEIILFEGAKSVMQAYGWGVKNTGALLTSHLSQYQFLLLIKLGFNVVFALDKEVDVRCDNNVMKLRHYTNVSWIHDISDLIGDKDSPADRGEEVFKRLYEGRRVLR